MFHTHPMTHQFGWKSNIFMDHSGYGLNQWDNITLTSSLIGWAHIQNDPCTLQWNAHDDVIKWKHFPRNWPFVRGIHRSPVNSQHKGQWRGALMFSLICVWINDWENNHEAGDLRRYRAYYDVTIMSQLIEDVEACMPVWTWSSLV